MVRMESVTRIFDLLQLYRGKYAGKGDVFAWKSRGKWADISASDYIRNSDHVSYALMALGIVPGDRVATIMGNSPFWNFLDMGILQTGGVHVPVYPTLSVENYRFIFTDARIRVLFIGCRAAYQRIKPVLNDLPDLQAYFVLEKQKGLKDWSDLVRLGRKNSNRDLLGSIRSSIRPEDLATLIYTSGTTGRPKGVMLSHVNMVSNFTAVSDILNSRDVNRALSFLPLCHVYERMLNYMYQYMGISVYYAESLDRLRENMREVKPEMFCAVPRVIEKSYATILRKGRNLKGIQKLIFFWALNLGHRFDFDLIRGPAFRLKLLIADRLVFRHWRGAFGGKLSIIVSGGAPLHPKLARVFWAAGIQVVEGYGLTETSPVIAVGTFEPGGVRFGTVGRPLTGVELKLAEDGEILVKGPNVMMGYYNRPDRNAEVFDEDGWFHTGDIGELVNGQYLKITDRKKEIFKTSLGKYIAPQVIENRIKESPFIESSMVIGENRNYPSALIVPNFEYLRSWCEAKGIEYSTNAEMSKTELVIQRIQREIKELNETLDHTWQVRKFILMEKEWSVESGELSPTLKVRRTYMQEKYAALIAGMYGEQIDYQPRHRDKKVKKPGKGFIRKK
ncbi:Long-chain-fatty-acid--CoA ligase FadD15 [bioreactor metagenome]|jgi:long-chain acyl-CoA synthetase|uniref:Long-chain-fatty-acid--CoA ligase FadD15 n=2 Tax=root TaxID=1 RepID=A0A644TAH3_9ZZZZ